MSSPTPHGRDTRSSGARSIFAAALRLTRQAALAVTMRCRSAAGSLTSSLRSVSFANECRGSGFGVNGTTSTHLTPPVSSSLSPGDRKANAEHLRNRYGINQLEADE